MKGKALHRQIIAAFLYVSVALISPASAQDSIDSILADIKSETEAGRKKDEEAQKTEQKEPVVAEAARKQSEAEQRSARAVATAFHGKEPSGKEFYSPSDKFPKDVRGIKLTGAFVVQVVTTITPPFQFLIADEAGGSKNNGRTFALPEPYDPNLQE
jgi:hypothetical protein